MATSAHADTSHAPAAKRPKTQVTWKDEDSIGKLVDVAFEDIGAPGDSDIAVYTQLLTAQKYLSVGQLKAGKKTRQQWVTFAEKMGLADGFIEKVGDLLYPPTTEDGKIDFVVGTQAKRLSGAQITREQTISLAKWQRMPNHFGVRSCTAMPLSVLRARLCNSGPGGVVWVESPMGTGKSSLGQLLEEFDGFELRVLSGKQEELANLDTQSRQPLYIDEAQRISLADLPIIRNRAMNSVVVLAGLSRVFIPSRCTKHDKVTEWACKHCFVFRCCNADEPVCARADGNHCFVETQSGLLREKTVVTVDELIVDEAELHKFLQLWDLEHRYPHLPPPHLTIPILRQLTGGMLGLTMHVLAAVGTQYQTTNGRRTLSAVELQLGVWSADFINALKNPSSTARALLFDLEDEEKRALVNMLRDSIQPGDKVAEHLRKKGILAKQPDHTWKCRSFLHEFILFNIFFVNPGHTEIVWQTIEQLIRFVLQGLHHHNIFCGTSMQHEDAVNRSIATNLAQSLPRSETVAYVGPCKITEDGQYAQCDHVIFGHPSLGTVLLEVLLGGKNLLEHTQRPDGRYAAYRANVAVTLDLRDNRSGHNRPTSIKSFAPSTNAHLFVAEASGSDEVQFDVYIPCEPTDPALGMKFWTTIS